MEHLFLLVLYLELSLILLFLLIGVIHLVELLQEKPNPVMSFSRLVSDTENKWQLKAVATFVSIAYVLLWPMNYSRG